MPSTVDDLIALVGVRPAGVDAFEGAAGGGTLLQRVFGGQVAAQAQTAADRTVDPAYVLHSVHASFLRPGRAGHPIRYAVDAVRQGRSFATRRVLGRQGEEVIFGLTASYHVPEDGYAHADAAPSAPPPDRCPTLGEVLARLSGRDASAFLAEWEALDVRYAGDTRPGGGLDAEDGPGARPARARVWLRVAGAVPDEDRLHRALLTYASDLTLLGATVVPHDTFVGAPGLVFASVDHAVWFHRPVRMDQWLLYDQVSPSASAGLGFATGRLFAEDGTLVASVAQEGLIRRGGPSVTPA